MADDVDDDDEEEDVFFEEANKKSDEEQMQNEKEESKDTGLKEEDIEDMREETDIRMADFFDNTENNIKIFFSWYYRDKGLIWCVCNSYFIWFTPCVHSPPPLSYRSELRCRDGPILISYFLAYLLRSHIVSTPESIARLRAALAVAERAKIELPATHVVGKALPDAWMRGCEEVMDNMSQRVFKDFQMEREEKEELERAAKAKEKEQDEDDEEEKEEREAKRRKVDSEEKEEEKKEGAQDKRKETLMEVEVDGVTVPVSMTGDTDKWEASATVPSGEPDAWGASGGDGGWGDGGWGDEDSGALDGGAVVEENLWIPNSRMMPYLGPTALPLTHTTGIVEKSIRRVVRIRMPPPVVDSSEGAKGRERKDREAAEGVEEELEQRLAQMDMEPWSTSAGALHAFADVQKPSLMPDSRGPVLIDGEPPEPPSAPAQWTPHDCARDTITVLLDPQTAETMMVGIGMGVGGTWVQLVRREIGAVDPYDEPEPESQGRRKGRKKGAFGVAGKPTPYWYLEQMVSCLPSFHTESASAA